MLAALTIGGCGAAAPVRDVSRIAVLPVEWATEDPLPALDERAPLAAGLREASELEVVEPRAACAEGDSDCVRRVGAEAGADRVLVASMASLGQTALARVTLLDSALGTGEQTRQEVISEVTAARVRAALEALGRDIGAPFAPQRPTPWYEEAWVWTVVGAVVVLTAASVAIGVAVSEQGAPDVVVVPP